VLAAALVFWGWQTGLWPAACLMASMLEGARLLPWRWDLARSDFNRVSDLCTIVFVSLVVYLGATTDAPRVLTLVFQWLPLVVLPLVAAQVFSTSPGVDVRIFLWSQRQKADAEGTPAPHTLDLRYPYFVICILAASAANVRGVGFYAGATALTAVALWSARPRAVRPAVWGGLFLLVAALGWVGHVGLHQAQRAVEAVALEWLAEWMRRDTDPFRSSTAIGSIGRLKLSDRIILRVDPGPSARMPLLLREATYNVFAMPAWLAVDATWAGATRGRRHHVAARGRRRRARAGDGVGLAAPRTGRARAARGRLRNRSPHRGARREEPPRRGQGGRGPRTGDVHRAERGAIRPGRPSGRG
jgi:hypothetical protein